MVGGCEVLDLEAVRRRHSRRIWCEYCEGNGRRRRYNMAVCGHCEGKGYLWRMDDDIAALIAEVERLRNPLHEAPVAEAVQATTPAEAAKAIAQELHRMLFKPRGGDLP